MGGGGGGGDTMIIIIGGYEWHITGGGYIHRGSGGMISEEERKKFNDRKEICEGMIRGGEEERIIRAHVKNDERMHAEFNKNVYSCVCLRGFYIQVIQHFVLWVFTGMEERKIP